MFGALDSGWSGPGSSPGRRYGVAFLGITLCSHSAVSSPMCTNGCREFNARGNNAMD